MIKKTVLDPTRDEIRAAADPTDSGVPFDVSLLHTHTHRLEKQLCVARLGLSVTHLSAYLKFLSFKPLV